MAHGHNFCLDHQANLDRIREEFEAEEKAHSDRYGGYRG